MILMDCPFCDYSNKNMVLLKNPLTYIIPDFSPLVIGHLLILPYTHVNGIANMDDLTLKDLNQSISYIESLYSEGQGTFFEHGAVVPSTAGSSINHAHLHFLPININFELLLSKQNFDLNNAVPIHTLSELRPFSIRHQPYIYWKYLNDDGFAYPVSLLRSQFLRFVIGETINESRDYNWHADSVTECAKDLVKKTVDDWIMRRKVQPQIHRNY